MSRKKAMEQKKCKNNENGADSIETRKGNKEKGKQGAMSEKFIGAGSKG